MEAIYALAAVTAFVTSLYVTPKVRQLALRFGVLGAPDERSMHVQPTPRIGGIAVYLGVVFALFVAIGFALQTTLFHSADDTQNFFGLLFGGTLIMLVGVWDDVMGMSPRGKFLAQVVVALVSMVYGFHIPGFRLPLSDVYVTLSPWVDYPLTLLWYLGMMNAINFLDGLDGLLAGVTSISGLFLFAIAIGHGHTGAALVLASLVGGALGFLPYNFNPAKIFLGDTGSLFIGYVFATVSILIRRKSRSRSACSCRWSRWACRCSTPPPSIWRRARAGKSIAEADRGHFHHVLIFRFGLNVRQAVLLIYALCFVLGAAAYLLSNPHFKGVT